MATWEGKIYQAAQLLPEKEIDQNSIQEAVKEIILAFGENPNREGLLRTPERVAQMYGELLAGYQTDPINLINDALFEVSYDETVLVRDIEYYSLCEHHLLPFFGKAHVAYIPKGKVIGLSKIPRIVDMFARRLQLQERMTTQIADFLNVILEPQGIAVVIEGLHLCAMMRGVKKNQARMTTTTMLGVFRTNQTTRREFLDVISKSSEAAG